MKMKRFLPALLLAVATVFSARAATPSDADLREIEAYLNSIQTLEAKFVQTASNGADAEGVLKIAKPNKIRMIYAAPADIEIVGDGNFIVYHDKELDQVTHIGYDDIPAALILGNDIHIDGKKIKVKDFYKDAGAEAITLLHKDSGSVGPITLVFSTSGGLELKQWKIVDPQKVEVAVSLYDIKKDVDFPDAEFKFKGKKKPKYNKK